ncbi:MAG: ABC transporter permease [Desulfobacterales bacterium]|nr:ABC transporter permease [Desulfobacterales bacterium]
MIKSFFYFIRLIFLQKHLIVSMAKREVATQYVGSLLGFVWTFINPLVMIFVFWVIFSVGFRVQPMKDVPFVVWLTAGMAAWFVFADIVNGSAGVVVANANLIKKTLFHSQILPIVRIVSSLISHSVFLVVLIGLIVFQKMPFSLYYLQFFYYLFCMSVLALGLGWAVSALNVFIRDVGQIVGLVLQIGFWATPIFWDIQIMPPKVQIILKLNPMFYIVQGYRESFIYFSPFWRHPRQTLYFWVVAIAIFIIGALIFKKLKPQFADVL